MWPRNAAMRLGVKALLTSLRTRVWSGGSIVSIERMPVALWRKNSGMRSRLSRMSGARMRSTEKRGSRNTEWTSR